MVHGNQRFDIVCFQGADQIFVVFYTLLVWRVYETFKQINSCNYYSYNKSKLTCWQNPRPCNRKSIGIDTHTNQKVNVFLPFIIRITSNITSFVIVQLRMIMGGSVPNVFTFAICIPTTFNLVSRRRSAPFKVTGELLVAYYVIVS